MKKIILPITAAVMSGVLFANIFNSMVIAVATDSDIPNSVIAGKEFFKIANPGDFFKIFSPASQLLTLLSLILFWKSSRQVRLFLTIALLCSITSDILAFTYFHPRTDAMNANPIPNVETLKRLTSEWSVMNWVRSFILLVGLVFYFLATDKIYISKNKLLAEK